MTSTFFEGVGQLRARGGEKLHEQAEDARYGSGNDAIARFSWERGLL